MTFSPLRSWGIHTVHNLFRCNPAAIRDPVKIHRFTDELVQRIDMKAYGPPQIVHFGDDGKAGYTLVQLIETSNIIAHFVEETNDAYVDVFSCKEFCKDEVEAVLRKYFRPEHISTTTLIRQAVASNQQKLT